MMPLQFRIQGFLLGAALAEFHGTGVLKSAPGQLPHMQHLLQTVRVSLQNQDVSWSLLTAQTDERFLYLNAAVLPLLYPGSPQQLIADWTAIAPQNCSIALQTAITLSYGIAVALHTPADFLTLQGKSLSFQSSPWLETIYRSVWRAPMDYRTSLHFTQNQLPENLLALTLTGALSGILNTIIDFPVAWIATLSELSELGPISWLGTLQDLAEDCLARWSGKLKFAGGEAIERPHWSTVAIAPVNQFRPR